MRAEDITAGIIARNFPPAKRKRTNWKKELKKERDRTINEVITKLKDEMRGKPKEWHRGYYSAITTLELMKDGSD